MGSRHGPSALLFKTNFVSHQDGSGAVTAGSNEAEDGHIVSLIPEAKGPILHVK